MLTEERQEVILNLLSEQGIVKSQALVKQLNTSESTIRRDLQELEEAGRLRRVHGGAKSIVKLDGEPNMHEKSTINIHEKQSIAKYAASLIIDGDFIYLDAGTSTYEMIPFLREKKIHVITNSVYHASALTDLEISTMIIGGTIKNNTKAVVSAFSLQQLKMFRFDKCFMGINGIHPDYGLTTPDTEEAAMKSVAIGQTEQVYFLADESKLNKVSFAKVAELNDNLILTNQLSGKIGDTFRNYTCIKEVTL